MKFLRKKLYYAEFYNTINSREKELWFSLIKKKKSKEK